MSALASPRGGYAEGMSIGNGGRTIESIVLDLMRPILKEWLDRNLPPMVERIVQKEIRKITRDLG
jgi:cell pole-organizing protein PopZ